MSPTSNKKKKKHHPVSSSPPPSTVTRSPSSDSEDTITHSTEYPDGDGDDSGKWSPPNHFPFPPGSSNGECVPWPGRTYVIRNRATDAVLAREHGQLVLKTEAAASDLLTCGWRWLCVCNGDGWLGFRETVSGVYLGRDNRGGFRAAAQEHRGWECFDARRHPQGGYQLLGICWWSRRRMEADLETGRVVEVCGGWEEGVGEAGLWDFERVVV
ncbi:hypothetical protein C8A05DRAFT_31984 [Staphylotrichum tortipilum]|uniref:Uncharacterized protein n=1 Tax=Staphylotrichum tortipilum TaxID=2831512 RepID=A0AAN6MNM9_9PEZI|nr:hypothetical protein C8A05DRAFT_31984 [Staphylotrichum longicolle]